MGDSIVCYIRKRKPEEFQNNKVQEWINDTCTHGYRKYIADGSNWAHNFEKEGEQKGVGYEAYYLSQMVFWHLLQYNSVIKTNCSVEQCVYCKNKMVLSKGIEFHFDVMHNPKTSHCRGMLASEKAFGEWKKWTELYHTIGNFTPIPWITKLTRKKFDSEHSIVVEKINLQRVHLHLDERWDYLLKYLKEHWALWKTNDSISFEDYMRFTCQQIYFHTIFSELYQDYKAAKDKDEFFTQMNWTSKVDEWNREISSDSPIVDLDSVNIVETVKKINFLIEARGHCILALLSSSLSIPVHE